MIGKILDHRAKILDQPGKSPILNESPVASSQFSVL
jgi:hypothetical protein